MDLGLYFRTLWRYKPLMLYGFFVAVLLAFLSAARITTHGIEQRGTTTWSSTATLLITSAHDFPYGRTAPAYLPADPRKGIPSVQVSDPNQLTTFALLYSQLANSDAVRKIMRRQGPLHGALTARPVFESPTTAINSSSYLLPLITLTATATTASWAVATAQLGTSSFVDFLSQQQDQANIPRDQRVSVEVLRQAAGASRISTPGLTLPIIVFIAVMIAAVALAFVLENLRPRALARSTTEELPDAVARENPIAVKKAGVRRA
jgi:hypothetical protein